MSILVRAGKLAPSILRVPNTLRKNLGFWSPDPSQRQQLIEVKREKERESSFRRDMTSRRGERIGRAAGVEENILAILDAPPSIHTQDADDDRFAFLEAVRAAFLASDNGTPSSELCAEVFRILRVGKSVEMIMESYCLLTELDQRFPRVFVSESSELVVIEEAWLPFIFGSDVYTGIEPGGKSASGPLDSAGFHQLIKDLKTNSQSMEMKSLRDMLLFQYLVNVLERDLIPLNRVYKETMNWSVLKESLLTMLLSSRRINYKALIEDCISILCGMRQLFSGINVDTCNNMEENAPDYGQTAAAIALLEAGAGTSKAMQKLLLLIMELDSSRKTADELGFTTRADGVRTPVVELILDELTYKDQISPFLQVFGDPKWKLEIIQQYFAKYTPQTSVRTRRSNGSTEDPTFKGLLGSFSNATRTRTITKRVGSDNLQVLLAHAFQLHLPSYAHKHEAEEISDNKGDGKSSDLVDICKSMISAFSTLKKIDERIEILPIAREALFVAATIMSDKS